MRWLEPCALAVVGAHEMQSPLGLRRFVFAHLALFDILLDHRTLRRARLALGAQQVAGREVDKAERLDNLGALRALASARTTQDEDNHRPGRLGLPVGDDEVLRHGLRRDRHHARAWRQNSKKPETHETDHRMPPKCPYRRGDHSGNQRHRPRGFAEGLHGSHPVVEDQARRPERQTHVAQDHFALSYDVNPWRNDCSEPCGLSAATGARDKDREEQPGRCETEVIAPATSPRRRKAASQEGPVKKEHHHRRRHHHLLRAHAQQAGPDRYCLPKPLPAGSKLPNKSKQGHQVKECAERLDPLDNR